MRLRFPACHCRQARERTAALALAVFLLAALAPQDGWAQERPKVRAVTAFVRLDRAQYKAQIADTLAFLRAARAACERAGYEVQSIRISTQPFPEYTRGASREEVLNFFRDYEALARAEGFDPAIGPAMTADSDSPAQAELLAEVLSRYPLLNASLVVGGEDGVRWNSLRAAAKIVKHLQEHSPGGIGNFSFAATAMVPPHTPFFPGSYHTGAGRRFALALQSANVVAAAFAGTADFATARRALEAALGGHARKVEEVARQIEKDSGWTYEGMDLSPAPLKDVSIGGAVEKLTRTKFGSSGTMTAAALITGVLHALPVKRAGYSGLMVPVLEDSVLAARWSEGLLTLDALLAYSAVCGTGLDTVPLPGDVTLAQLERILGDMASLAVKLKKPLSARLMPVTGKKPGDRTTFDDPFLVNATIQRLP
jgi:uncharacterized protein (UPF0210 family)